MDLTLSESQQMLRTVVRDFMERELPREAIVALQASDTGIDPRVWRSAADLGWLGLLLPVEYGGSGGSHMDAAVLFEELGRGPLPGPFFSSAVLAAITLLEGGTEQQQRRHLPAVASGEAVLTLAINEPERSWGPQGVALAPVRQGNRLLLNGTKLFVSDATAATHLIVAVRTGPRPQDIGLCLVDKGSPGVSVERLPGFVGWRDAIRFEHVEIGDEDFLGAPDSGWSTLERAFERALPILCAYEVGGCQAVFEMSVAYSNSRHQFGVPIGRFQRVQDHIIRLANHLDSARWVTNQALWKLDAGKPARADAHMAKAVASEAYFEACNAAHEVLAGIGSDHAYGLTAHTQMSRTLFQFLGDPKWHKRRMADALAW